MRMLNAWCIRAGIDREKANCALLEVIHQYGAEVVFKNKPAVYVVEIDGQEWVVSWGKDSRLFIAFPLPFDGWVDEYKYVPPIGDREEAKILLKMV